MGSFNGKSTSNGRCQLQSLVGLVLCFQGIMGWRCVTLTWVKLSDFTFSHEKIRLQHVFLRNHIFLCERLGASLQNSNSTIVPVSSAQKPLDDEMWVEFGWNCCAFPGQRKLKVCVAGSSLKGVSQMKEMFGSHNIVTESRRLQSGTFGGTHLFYPQSLNMCRSGHAEGRHVWHVQRAFSLKLGGWAAHIMASWL